MSNPEDLKVLVTGAGGFVGRELTRQLVAAGHSVLALDRQLTGLEQHPNLTGIEIDISDSVSLSSAMDTAADAVIHLATVPGNAAEHDPVAARQVNVGASMHLLEHVAGWGTCPRFVFASSIAVLGDLSSYECVDDTTSPAPTMIYGLHKAMIESAIAAYSRRNAISGISLRLPGIVARPAGPSGMKSAFMSEVFHALVNQEPITLPVSAEATFWIMSVRRCAANLVYAIDAGLDDLPEHRALTLPALHVSAGDLVAEIERSTDAVATMLRFEPDPDLQRVFGSLPRLVTPAADSAGFTADEDLPTLVSSALAAIREV